MREVRAYLAASANTTRDQAQAVLRNRSATVRGAQFNVQVAMASRLSEIAARLGEVEPNSKLGAPGVFLKRLVRKAIGWYSRPAQEFDRATIELLQQIRQDMVGLQHQIAALREQVTSDVSQQVRPIQDSDESERRGALLLMIELFKNVTALQAFRQALRDEDPQLLRQLQTLLDQTEDECRRLKAALRRSLNAEER